MLDEIYVDKDALKSCDFLDCKGPLDKESIYGNIFHMEERILHVVVLQSFKKSSKSRDMDEISFSLKLLREDELDRFVEDFYALEKSGRNKKFVSKELLRNNEELRNYFIAQHLGRMIMKYGVCDKTRAFDRQLTELLEG